MDENIFEISVAHVSEVTRLGQTLRDSLAPTMSPILPDAADLAFDNLREPERFAANCWQDLTTQNLIKGMLFVVEDKFESIHIDPAQKRQGCGPL